MQASNYVVPIETNKENYLFSTLYKSLIHLDKNRARLWENGCFNEALEGKIPPDIRHKFLVSEGIDEFNRAYHYLTNPPFRKKTLYATIVVTLECNMHCSYCHEKGGQKGVFMAKNIAKEVGQFLAGLANRSQYGLVLLYFYGGEPLLNLDAILTVIKEIGTSTNALVKVQVPTNGLILKGAILDRLLSECTSLRLQVTLDGPRDIHDARRPTAKGGSTFDRILKNIENAADKASVTVRTNVDRLNAVYVPKLVEELQDLGLVPKRVGWYAFPVMKVINGSSETNKVVLSPLEWLEAAEKIWSMQNSRGIPLRHYEPGDGLCGIRQKSVLTIDCNGGLHPCTGIYRKTNGAMGHIGDGRLPWENKKAHNFSNACRKCAYFPYCGGGCQARVVLCGGNGFCPKGDLAAILPVYLQYKYRLK